MFWFFKSVLIRIPDLKFQDNTIHASKQYMIENNVILMVYVR